jgi:hypothetical protein
MLCLYRYISGLIMNVEYAYFIMKVTRVANLWIFMRTEL